MRLIPKDAEGFEKFVYPFVEIGAVLWLLVYQLSAWQILKNQYQRTVAEASGIWHILGFVLFLLAIFTPIAASKDWLSRWFGLKLGATVNIIVFILLALSIFAYSGFDWNFKVW